jgi:TPR repeat protein
MRGKKPNIHSSIACVSIILIMLFVNNPSAMAMPDVPEEYRRFFFHYEDKRSFAETALNLIGLTNQEVGRSFALIAGVSSYPNMPLTERQLKPAAIDIKNLQSYLKSYEFFDEIVVLENDDVTTENLEYFLQTYFPNRLQEFPKSRFLFAYSGHGMTEQSRGYLLKSTARSLKDKGSSINLGVIRQYVDEVVRSGHHVLILLNACYCGSFLKRPFGETRRLIPRNRGAHAITAGGTGEQAWHDPEAGEGSLFYEKLLAGLDGQADSSRDSVITVDELYSYLKQEVQVATDQEQNPRLGDLLMKGSKGGFFFLNRDHTAAVSEPEEPLEQGRRCYRQKDYEAALSFFRQAAIGGSVEAMGQLSDMYFEGRGAKADWKEALRWAARGVKAADRVSMRTLGRLYFEGKGVPKDASEAVYWFRSSANAGDLWSQASLAILYFEGKDYEEAFCYAQMAANGGYQPAMYLLGQMYESGMGVAKDPIKAAEWYDKSLPNNE